MEPPNISLIRAMYDYLDYLRVVKGVSKHTLRNYAVDCNSFLEYIGQHELQQEEGETLASKILWQESYDEQRAKQDESFSLSLLDRQLCRRFLAFLHNEQKSKRTVVRRLSVLRSLCKYLLSCNLLKVSPLEGLESPKIGRPIPHALEYREVERLFEQPDLSHYLGFRDRCIMELFYSSGLRVGELVALNRRDFDLQQLTLHLRGKGNRERLIPITKQAAGWLCDYLNHAERQVKGPHHFPEEDQEAIFLNKWGRRLSVRSVDRSFKRYTSSSGLPRDVTPHTIRHTIATHLLEQGMDIKVIRDLLGHSSVQTTQIYTEVSPALKKQVYDQTHPRA